MNQTIINNSNQEILEFTNTFSEIKESLEALIRTIPFESISGIGEFVLLGIFTTLLIFGMPKYRGGGVITLSTVVLAVITGFTYIYLHTPIFTNGLLALNAEPLSIGWVIYFVYLSYKEHTNGIDGRSTMVEASVFMFLIDMALGFCIPIWIIIPTLGYIALSLDEVDVVVGIADKVA